MSYREPDQITGAYQLSLSGESLRVWHIGSASLLQSDEKGSIPFIRSYGAYAEGLGDELQPHLWRFESTKHLLSLQPCSFMFTKQHE